MNLLNFVTKSHTRSTVHFPSNFDRNLSSLWLFVIIITAAGSLFSTGKEGSIKGILFFAGSLIIGVYFLTAPIFNADEKFKQAKMAEKIEIEAFDEKETPASVPPQFVRNEMKKAFGQVPNTSYYDLHHLQIQKVNGEYVYIAPVEFSGFFKWWNGNQIPSYFTLSATDSSSNPKFMKAEMLYTPSSYFHKNIERHIRMHYPKHIFCVGTVDGSSNAEEKQHSGTVVRVYKEKSGGYTIISFLLDNQQSYVISSENNPLSIYLQEGDKVNIHYLETGENFLPVKEMIIEGLE